ncbi:uncharacterized protein TRUGW13939_11260 [Talaromyces rugulosus]|uniref:Transcription factor domain-containing protein n=1 Tax=Talaromyces rugulosus TaxID=121627 RepID=A0A7H8RDC4_TALRU|nr:uncharacterized protein TRUGW13939_11260 [Talaromyces rugulosus]QKX64087.1 hypothetical protein TRUGW13939_11260 [Talaromyces rugulosus]
MEVGFPGPKNETASKALYFSSRLGVHGRSEDFGSAQPTIPAQIPSRRLNSAAEHNLFQYFDHVVVQALATIPRTSVTLRAVIARLALSSNAQSSQAVMQSIFALSSLHRHGIQLQTIKFKTSALGALRSSSGSGIGRHEVARHIAALMLLCAYEIEQAWNSSCQWLFYINGVKNVIKASSPSIEQDTDHEYLALLDWVHYQDTMAHFSLHHWRLRKRPGKDPGFDQLVSLLPKPGVKISLKFEQPPISHFIFLRLLSEVFSTVQDKSYPTFCGEDYKNRLKLLELNISRVKNDDVSICFYEQDTARCFEVFQLAALIYITRMLGDSGDDDLEETTNSRISAGFAILAKMGTCTRQFPLLVLGCEARSDFDRITILDLIDRTRVKFPSACLVGLRNLIQTLWAQDDLAEEALEYEKKLTAVISSSETLPALF